MTQFFSTTGLYKKPALNGLTPTGGETHQVHNVASDLHSYEIMECIGGSGVMENSIYPRLFRESVINPIWEGSGNSIFDTYLNNLNQQFMQLNPADLHGLQYGARTSCSQRSILCKPPGHTRAPQLWRFAKGHERKNDY